MNIDAAIATNSFMALSVDVVKPRMLKISEMVSFAKTNLVMAEQRHMAEADLMER